MIHLSGPELEHPFDGERPDPSPGQAPGRRTLTSRLAPSPASIARAVVAQLKEASAGARLDGPAAHAAAAHGTRGGGEPLPFLAEIQRAFGHHDVTGVRAHVGGAAAEASAALGARAYAVGDDVAFAAAPDLHLAAHEAAHVVQQRAGVRLAGGVGAAGDEYERHADEVADAVCRGEFVEELLGGKAHRGAGGGPAVQRHEEDEVAEVDFVFFFTGGDSYGRAARAYIDANYGGYERRDAASIEEMFAILQREIAQRERGGGRVHLGHVVLVSHASVAQPTDAEAAEGAQTGGELYIAPVRGSDERLSAESLAQLQGDFRRGLHARFRRDRRAVVGAAIDEQTTIEIRGCRIAQSAETMAAMRDLFGGNAEVRAPTGYQGYAVVPWDEARTPLPQAIEILIEQGSVPASSRALPAAEQRRLVEGFVAEHGGLPTQHFVPDGTGDREAIAGMTGAELTGELAQPGAGPHASRDGVDLPDTGNEWGHAGEPDARDPALERLPRAELERRARALLDGYTPDRAPELQRLRHAWTQVTFRRDDDDPADPIAGLPPEDVFGDPSVIDRDAARARRGHDRFEEDDVELTEPTGRQRDELDGEPDDVSVAPDAPAASTAEPAPRPRRRPARRRTGGDAAEPAPPASDLRLLRCERRVFVFNRPAFRDEVAAALFEPGFTPGRGELIGDDTVDDGQGELIVGAERWTLPINAFNARRRLYEHLRPEIRQMMDEPAQPGADRGPTRPPWVPAAVWQRFLSAGAGMHRYPDCSPIETDIVLVRRDGRVAGYCEAQEREDVLFRQLSVEPPETLERIFGLTTVEQRQVQLYARTNGQFNRYMWRQVAAGEDPLTARNAYPERVMTRYLAAYIEVLGFNSGQDIDAIPDGVVDLFRGDED